MAGNHEASGLKTGDVGSKYGIGRWGARRNRHARGAGQPSLLALSVESANALPRQNQSLGRSGGGCRRRPGAARRLPRLHGRAISARCYRTPSRNGVGGPAIHPLLERFDFRNNFGLVLWPASKPTVYAACWERARGAGITPLRKASRTTSLTHRRPPVSAPASASPRSLRADAQRPLRTFQRPSGRARRRGRGACPCEYPPRV